MGVRFDEEVLVGVEHLIRGGLGLSGLRRHRYAVLDGLLGLTEVGGVGRRVQLTDVFEVVDPLLLEGLTVRELGVLVPRRHEGLEVLRVGLRRPGRGRVPAGISYWASTSGDLAMSSKAFGPVPCTPSFCGHLADDLVQRLGVLILHRLGCAGEPP